MVLENECPAKAVEPFLVEDDKREENGLHRNARRFQFKGIMGIFY